MICGHLDDLSQGLMGWDGAGLYTGGVNMLTGALNLTWLHVLGGDSHCV